MLNFPAGDAFQAHPWLRDQRGIWELQFPLRKRNIKASPQRESGHADASRPDLAALTGLTTLTGAGQGSQDGQPPIDALLPSERRRANVLRTMTMTSFGSLLLAH